MNRSVSGTEGCWKLSILTAAFCYHPLLLPPALFLGEVQFISNRFVASAICVFLFCKGTVSSPGLSTVEDECD